MVEKSELLKVPAFEDLPDDQIDWFISQAQELNLHAGDTAFRADDPADAMFVFLEGQLQVRGELAGETVVIPVKPGDVTGVLPFSRMKQFTVGAKAICTRLGRAGWIRLVQTVLPIREPTGARLSFECD